MILVDTGPLVAAADADDDHHERCRLYLETAPRPLLVPSTVVPEVCYLLERNLGSAVESAFLRAFPHELTLETVTVGDLQRAAHLIDQYQDLPLGLVDASVIAIAERLRVATIATLDQRHFRIVRPAHIDGFTLMPPISPRA